MSVSKTEEGERAAPVSYEKWAHHAMNANGTSSALAWPAFSSFPRNHDASPGARQGWELRRSLGGPQGAAANRRRHSAWSPTGSAIALLGGCSQHFSSTGAAYRHYAPKPTQREARKRMPRGIWGKLREDGRYERLACDNGSRGGDQCLFLTMRTVQSEKSDDKAEEGGSP